MTDDFAELVAHYTAGDNASLAVIVDRLQPHIRAVLCRYRWLPASIDREDLEQESWRITATLARRWQPTAPFLAYFTSSFRVELQRYVTRARLDRGADVDVMSLAPENLVRIADPVHQEPSPEYSELLAQVQALPRRERLALVLRVFHELEFRPIGELLGVSRMTAHRNYRSACAQLRKGMEPNSVQGEPGFRPEALTVLRRHARPDGRLPGRRRLQPALGVDRRGYDALMARLEADGLIERRGGRWATRMKC